ncbi:myotubularin-related protein 8-like [Dendronephthya gigantea]|uniref:myotubularin-related protein 8-like n=1 Tax=Dendronephthya gigantea TaxID=151771 RepID=UPI001069F2C8|nr:myotubularin-related protein 8-like [Dendronephthya gigantea]
MDSIKTTQVENVRLIDRHQNQKATSGTLYVTATHLIFVDPAGKRERWIIHHHIQVVEKLPLSTVGSPLRISCKNFLTVTFVIPRERECQDVYSTLLELSTPDKLEQLYAFSYNPMDDKISSSAGWVLYDARLEFSRMGISADTWQASDLNEEFKLCDTYPRILFLPASASKETAIGSAMFRSRNRLPTLSYYHKTTKAAICRSSQPLSGLNARSLDDEQMVNAILKSNKNAKQLYIVDTRPKINAMANRAAGKGYENTEFYENVEFQFLGIENIHVMRQSLQKLVYACGERQSGDTFLDSIDNSSWLKHIKCVLDTSYFIAKAVNDERKSVLVHCSDGWDRTAQTCSIASILLDPFFRTIHGLQVLIEKEWLSFGHKFVDRCGFLRSDGKEVSPVFTQFLDGVWQLQQQFPFAFQFNERFLLTIHDHVHSCQFGTFLGNCEKERRDLSLSEKTYSLWGYMWQNVNDFVNPLFNETKTQFLRPRTSPQYIRFWRAMYNRHENSMHSRETVTDAITSLVDQNDSIQDHISLLTKRIELMKIILEEGGNDSDLHNGPEKNSDEVEVSKDTKNEESTSTSTENKCLSSIVQKELRRQGISLNDLVSDNPRLSLDWRSFRGVTQCSCASPIDTLTRKYHCWNCGEVFCRRCIDYQTSLPGHYSENKVPVCKSCFKKIAKKPNKTLNAT